MYPVGVLFGLGFDTATEVGLLALIIGTIELVSILTDQLSIDSGPLAAIGNLDLNDVGFAIVGLFVVTWIVALAVWRFARIEDRWTAQLKATTDSPPSAD